MVSATRSRPALLQGGRATYAVKKPKEDKAAVKLGPQETEKESLPAIDPRRQEEALSKVAGTARATEPSTPRAGTLKKALAREKCHRSYDQIGLVGKEFRVPQTRARNQKRKGQEDQLAAQTQKENKVCSPFKCWMRQHSTWSQRVPRIVRRQVKGIHTYRNRAVPRTGR